MNVILQLNVTKWRSGDNATMLTELRSPASSTFYIKQNSFSILLFPGMGYDEAVPWAQNGQGLPQLKSRSWGVPLG